MASRRSRRRRIRYLSKTRVIALWLGLSVLTWPVVYLVAYAITALGAETAATVVALALGGLIFASIAILNDLNINVFSLAKELFQAASRDMSRLEYAASRGDRKRVTELLSKENQSRFDTLRRAVSRDDMATIRLLLECGIDVNVKSKDGRTALMVASSEEVAGLLLEAGADLNAVASNGQTALHALVRTGTRTKTLLNSGANIRAVDDDGRTVVHAAIGSFLAADTAKKRKRMQTIVEELLVAGCDPSVTDIEGNNALHELLKDDPSDLYLCESFVPGELADMASTLAKSISNLNGRNTDGESPLHLAAKCLEYGECIQTLIANGGSVNFENNHQETPLHLAVSQDNTLAMEILLQHEADPNILDVLGHTPLHRAIDAIEHQRWDDENAHWPESKLIHVNMLLSSGADPNAMKTESPLHRACAQYELDTDLIHALIGAGGDVTLLNNRGQSSLDLLRQHRDRDTAAVLLERYDQKKAG